MIIIIVETKITILVRYGLLFKDSDEEIADAPGNGVYSNPKKMPKSVCLQDVVDSVSPMPSCF